MMNGANPGVTDKCMMLYSFRYVNFEKNTHAITITEEVAIWQLQSRNCQYLVINPETDEEKAAH